MPVLKVKMEKTTYSPTRTGYSNGGTQYSVTVPCGTVVKYSGSNLGYDGANPRTLYHTESGVVLHHHTEGHKEDDSREDFYHTVTINATGGEIGSVQPIRHVQDKE